MNADPHGLLAAMGLKSGAEDAPLKPAPPSRRRPPRQVSEVDVREGCVALILELGGYVIVKHQTGFDVRGTPDLIYCLEGRMGVHETKRNKTKRPTSAQFSELRKWDRAGALASWGWTVGHLRDVLAHVHDPQWRHDLEFPGDGGARDEPW
ncbi:MAG: hypothetical protein ACRDTZ_03310 [Pseudonocardiaceae bacterium]